MSDLTHRDFIKSLGALIGATIASEFAHQLEALARALPESQEWVLSFDEVKLEQLARRRVRLGNVVVLENNQATAECTFEIEIEDLWALATLTDPDGVEWASTDGETWTSKKWYVESGFDANSDVMPQWCDSNSWALKGQSEAVLRRCGVCETMRQDWGMDKYRCDACCWDALETEGLQ